MQTSTPRTSLSPNFSVDTSNISQVPSTSSSIPPTNDDDDRFYLLNSITDFSISQLKKTTTNDRSAPILK